jgi:pyrroloquinoline quinone biosynthesis protein B
MSIKLKVLGTAQDGGIPHMNCYKTLCRKARMDTAFQRRASSVAFIDTENLQVSVIDATPAIHEQMGLLHDDPDLLGREERNPVDAFFLTHAHYGHYFGLAQLGREVMNATEIPVYASEAMCRFLERNAPWEFLIRSGNIRLHPISFGQWISWNSLSFQALKVPHRDEYADTAAYRVEGEEKSVFYVPDIDSWEEWELDIAKVLEDVDYALIDGTFYTLGELPPWVEKKRIPHPPVVETMDRLQHTVDQYGVKVYFTHLNHTNLLLTEGGRLKEELENRGFFLLEEGMEFRL